MLPPTSHTLAAEALVGGDRHPVTLSFGTGLSLAAAFPPEKIPLQRVFDGLVIHLAGRDVELSRCRLDHDDSNRPGTGRLVFLDDVYDCRALIRDGKLLQRKGALENCAMVFGQRAGIRREFRELVADLTYDLSAYRRSLTEEESALDGEPDSVAEAARAAALTAEAPAFFHFFDEWLVRLEAQVARFDPEEHEHHGFYLRRVAWEVIRASRFLTRTNLKPRGYAGDADMMVMVYENQFVGDTVFERLMHRHPLETAAAKAVRARRGYVADALASVRRRLSQNDEPFRFCSVGSGPAFELVNIFAADGNPKTLHATLIDQDPIAHGYAAATVDRLSQALGEKLTVEHHNDSVRTMLRKPGSFGKFHFIYSMGLFDYLTPPVAKALLERLYDLLVPGGALFIGNFHRDCPTRQYMAYFMDWSLYFRSEQELRELAEDLPSAITEVGFEPTRSQMFLRVDKL